ncbi:hypothetical protein HUT16_30220 [Kitasatospora sp. NA04385]|uniref:hypothetical protein n=1 Tax=Kitasatospora sp. NA04385 TaxID=2742135 RepID=UPI0015903EB5|nr:hypothetical protein [Kitasatospora sp. NA04385]QKW22797.1 hypothetical protein HUT16_30220 [Kitasatospora sp. NA04385]
MLDPLVGVGPLRFGMSPAQVREALEVAGVQPEPGVRTGEVQEYYDEPGLSAFYGPGPRLVAVLIDATGGPLVRLGEVELVARVPSEARADIRRLALLGGAEVRVNRHGEPEVPAWGLSVCVVQEWGHAPTGPMERRDRMITGLLATGPELAEDPWNTEPVARLTRPSHDRQTPPDPPPVTVGQDRSRWECAPLRGVGPLRFGMSPRQVAAALGGREPVGREGHHPFRPGGGRDLDRWELDDEHYDHAGVSAHYWEGADGPELNAVSVHGRTGPQVLFQGIELVGRRPSVVEAELFRHAEDHPLELRYTPYGNVGSVELNVWVRSERDGDSTITGALFCVEQWVYSED